MKWATEDEMAPTSSSQKGITGQICTIPSPTLFTPATLVNYVPSFDQRSHSQQPGTQRSFDSSISTQFIWKKAMAASTSYSRLLRQQLVGLKLGHQATTTRSLGQASFSKKLYVGSGASPFASSMGDPNFEGLPKFFLNSTVSS